MTYPCDIPIYNSYVFIILGGKIADLGQFPWMVLLGYKQKYVDIQEFLCGGTVITEKYVLTAAHCLQIEGNHQLEIIRLGEYDVRTKIDCVISNGQKICADEPVDFPIESQIIHPQYDPAKLKNDIGLIRVKGSIKFSKYIQPICLPFERKLETIELTGQKFTISGWGKTQSKNIGGSNVPQYATVSVRRQSECNAVIPPEVQPMTDNQLCANGEKEDACKGDSGGPLSNSTLDIDEELRNFQIGVISFASAKTCGVEELPSVYTRVDKYLTWIVDSVE